MANGRVVIVSNRLPVAVRAGGDSVRLVPSSGGLATGLRAHHEGSNGLWVGWPGDVSHLTPEQRAALEPQFEARGIVPVYLTQEHVERYYNGFANRVLWPLFHYLIDRVPVHATGWEAYRQVNEAFAEAVARHHREGDTIWVHDYHLMLLPALLRERLPDARIGCFLHIPFPSSEVFRVLPWRREVLNGLLGADLVGFHTFAYLRHFLASLMYIDGVERHIDTVRVGARTVQAGVFPMGIDAKAFAAEAESAEVLDQAARLRREAGGRQIILGVDRLDYTKGIPRRLQAIQRLLEVHPDLRDRVRYVQVAVPSRDAVDSYQRFRRLVEESVGRINGKVGTLTSTPIHYIHASVTRTELVALYCAADVMLVTPLRDGMNLVAKEFAASRVDEAGVLVLSEFAGAAAELDGAVTVNPYDIEAVAATIFDALSMPREEQAARMRLIRSRVVDHDIHAWSHSFLDRLQAVRPYSAAAPAGPPETSLSAVLAEARRSKDLHLLLDYDGTLVPIVRRPELAAPDADLLTLLARLATSPRTRVEIVSGRPRDTLERWFDDVPLALWAEHGFWFRPAPRERWQAAAEVPNEWLDRIESMLDQFAASTPGAEVERKRAAVAWHYRRADRSFGARQAHELRMLLGSALANQPFEVVEGKKVIEVRMSGISKGLVARDLASRHGEDPVIIAFGDDRTDEDLFRALPASSITIAVGQWPANARFRVADYRDVRRILQSLRTDAPAPAADARPTAGSTRS